jgi:PIN domain nuclease of toxin-antitoxin system
MSPKRFVFDTHACVMALNAADRLGRKAKAALRAVEEGTAQGFIPAAVVTEVLLLRDLGRTRIGLPELRELVDAGPNVRFLPLDLDQLDEFAALALLRDPFDRLIVSAARVLKARLLTRDAKLAGSGLVQTVWS